MSNFVNISPVVSSGPARLIRVFPRRTKATRGYPMARLLADLRRTREALREARETIRAARPYVDRAYDCAFPDDARNREVLAGIDAVIARTDAEAEPRG